MKNEQKTTICTRDKKEVCLELLKSDHVLVHVNATTEGVVVPDSFRNDVGLRLRLSYLFVGELLVGDDVINVTLRFSGKYVNCVIPWNAIWAMTSDTGDICFWPESVPTEVLETLAPVPHIVKEMPAKHVRTHAVKKSRNTPSTVATIVKTPESQEPIATTTDKQAHDRQDKRRSLLKRVK